MTTAKGFVARSLMRWEAILVILIIACGVWSWTLSSFFLTRPNLLDLATPYIYLGLLALGLSFVVVAGEIDISVVSTMTASAVVIAQVAHTGLNIWIAAVIGLATASVLGLFNGILVGIMNLPSLAVTLGTLAAYRGLAYVLLGGEARTSFPRPFGDLGGGYWLTDIPVALLVFCIFAVALAVLLHATRVGRYVYQTGSGREAARFSGIPATRVRVGVFVLSGFMAGIAGVVYLGFFDSIQSDAASGAELIIVITVVVIGGISIFGGTGSIAGVALAFFLVAEIRNGMQLANIASPIQDIVVGCLLIAAIVGGNAVRSLPAYIARVRHDRMEVVTKDSKRGSAITRRYKNRAT